MLGQSPFIDKANQYNLNHSYNSNNAGGGVSCIDFNLDGLDDITLASAEGEPIKFYINKGNGQFEQINLIPDNLFKLKQIIWVDFDNDGDKDLFAAAFDGVNKLYRNNGSLQLEDISEQAGIPQDTTRTMGVNFGDYNRDGWLDLYYCERSLLGANTINQNRLFKNQADGTFIDVSLETNSSDKNRLPFCSVFADFNNDNWPDIYIANDRRTRNTLLVNYEGFFLDASVESNSGLEMEAMSTAIGDYNKDGLLDAYVSNNSAGNKFLVNCPDSIDNIYPVFNELADDLNITVNGDCWGSILFDSNNDSNLDIYVSSALVGSDTVQSVLFEQTETGTFEVSNSPMIGDTVSSFNNAIGDFNGDGFSDIVVMNKAPFNLNLWENQNQSNNWIKIKLNGIISNSDAIGCRMELFHSGIYQQIYTTAAIGFFGQNSDQYIFGLGEFNTIDSLVVTWPTGHIDTFKDLNSNENYSFYEGQSTEDFIHIDSNIIISQMDTIAIDTTSTIKEINYKEIECFPNPASTKLLLDIGHFYNSNLDIEAINVEGMIFSLENIGNTINIEKLQNGIYLLSIRNDDHIYFSKFIKFN